MSTAATFVQLLRRESDRLARQLQPRRAWVGDETNGKVTLSFTAGSSAGQQRHARLVGTPFAAGTEVLVLPIEDGQYVVLGAIQGPET